MGFVIPQIGSLAPALQALNAQEKQFNDMKTKVTFLSTQDMVAIQKDIDLMQQVLPSVKPVIPLLSSLDYLAQSSGVAIKSLDFSPGKVATQSAKIDPNAPVLKGTFPGVASLPLKLEAEGSFLNMNKFFETFDTVVPLLNIKSIEFSSQAQSSQGAPTADQPYKATVELESLYLASGDTNLTGVLVALTPAQQAILTKIADMIAAQPIPTNNALTFPVNSLRQNVFVY